MSDRFKRVVRTITVILVLAMALSGCRETAKVQEKPVVQTEKKAEKKETKKSQEPSESAEHADEYEEEIIEVEVEEQDGESPSASYNSTSKGESDQVEEVQENSGELTCYLSIYCDTILDHMDKLEAGKEVLVPSDGTIYAEREVTFTKGETVFDVLLRETKRNGIHMEYSFTPGFNSNYIEGIANLYEMDCGPNSGWMYCVNGVYPDYGCSVYKLEDQDVIEWNYTCDLGRDL